MITPQFIGQVYKDTLTGDIWRANSLITGDWTLEVQNLKVAWEPAGFDLGSKMGFFVYRNPLSGLTSLTFYPDSSTEGFDLESIPDLVSVSFPNLVTAPDDVGVYLLENDLLTSVSLPLYEGNAFNLINCDVITSLALPAFTTHTGLNFSFAVRLNVSLTSLSLPNYVPDNDVEQLLDGNALDVTSVNAFLALAVANASFTTGRINLGGGTNAAPTGQGIVDVATLTGRGCDITTN